MFREPLGPKPERALAWLVDDSPLEAERIARALSARFDVEVFGESSSMLERLTGRRPPDALVLDWLLPDISGVDVCRHLRSSPATAGLPVLIVTSRQDRADVIEALSAGADDYMVKPLDTAELVARVTALVRTRQLHLEAEEAARTAAAAARRAQLGADLGAALTGSAPLPAQFEACAEAIARNLDVARVRLWMLGETESVLELRASAGPTPVPEGVPARPLRSPDAAAPRPFHGDPLALAPGPEERAWVAREGLTDLGVYPLVVHERLVGVLEVLARRTLDEEAHVALRSAADSVALGVGRARAEGVLTYLAQASAALASSLDYATTMRNVVRLAVPAIADFCALHVVSGEGLQLAVIAHADASKQELLRRAERAFGVSPGDAHGPGAVAKCGQSTLVPALSPELLQRAARSPEHLEAIAALDPGSLAIVPLTVHGHTFGALTLGTSGPRRRYDAADLALAEELARRVAVAVDNARLYQLAERERTRVEEANRAKDEFLATVSHELRTPLNAILGWTRMLRAGSLSEDKRPRALETIERNAQAQTQLIEDLLDVSRIISGKLRLHVRSVDIAATVESAIEAVRPAASAKGIKLVARLEPDAAPLVGDPDRLLQIASNLLTNAVKFTGRGGQVSVHLRRAGGVVELSVEDTGQGIEPAFLPYVFDRFRQADGSTARQHGGLGLGLSIVKHLVELHGGTISAESEGPGRGARFTVKLPSVRPPLELDLAGPSSQPGGQLHFPPEIAGLRVVVVDDVADARELVASVLEGCRARVTVATSAAEAFQALRETRPDVLVSDIGMPGEDGVSMIRRIRALAPDEGGLTLAVALTAYARSEDRRRALLAGFNAYVPKPIEPAELLAVLAGLVAPLRRR